MINKTEAMAIVDAIASRRLFGDEKKWLVEGPNVANALNETLRTLGLVEEDGRYIRFTALGKELNIDLQQVFMGLWEPWDAIHVLEQHDLLSADEIDSLVDLLEVGEERFEPIFKTLVQQAYRDYYGATRLH
jgi:hypothetical protein